MERGRCAARNGIIWVKQMKQLITALCMAYAAAAFASPRIEVSALPQSEYADTEVATNVALNVNAARLERLTLSVAFETSETNEVLVALGADTDGNGDLSLDESDVVFGCDCGAWYRADLRTGETTQQTTNILVIGKREFDSAWNVFKVIRRGLGEIGESVTLDEERVRFDIRVR